MAARGGAVKTIDLRKYFSSTAQKVHFLNLFCEALKADGCCLISHSGVNSDLVSAVRTAAVELFSLSADFKSIYSGREIYGQRGYSNFGAEKAYLSSIADLKEYWTIGREGKSSELHKNFGILQENRWPTAWVKAEAFRLITNELYGKLDTLSQTLMSVVAKDIREDEDEFAKLTMGGDSVLRLAHYPPPPPLNLERSNASTDRDLLSFLMLDTEAEVWDRAGNLLKVPPSEDQILVVVGEMLENLTNGIYKASLHREIGSSQNRDSEARLAISFFAHPRLGTDLSPRSYCVSKAGVSRYPTVLSGQYLEERLQETYTPFLKAC